MLAFDEPTPIGPTLDVTPFESPPPLHLDGIGWLISALVLFLLAAVILYLSRAVYEKGSYWIAAAVALVPAVIFLIRGLDQLFASVAAWVAAGGGLILVAALALILYAWGSSND